MPHKRNPIGCEQIVGLARLLRGNAHGGARERRAVARARHLALVGRARHPARQLHRARSHAAPLHADRPRHGRLSRSGCARTSSARAASCSRAPCCSSSPDAASRASRPTSGCSATRCARSHEQRDFKELLLADRRRHARAVARRRSSRRSISTSSCSNVDHDLRASLRDGPSRAASA